jgi:phosphopantothenoylcysteine decarboxylase
MEGRHHNILVGVTGSVASIKLGLLVTELKHLGEVRVVSTNCAEHFWGNLDLPSDVRVYRDRDEWSVWQKMGDEVLHIELRRWASVFVVAPLDANSLAKLAHGQCDNLLTCVARCWDVAKGTMIVAPAMNTLMWTHPATTQSLDVLQSWKVMSRMQICVFF